MNIYALELDNDIKGISERKQYIEGIIRQLSRPDLVVLPELALCSYMGNKEIWQYADTDSRDAGVWATEMAEKYRCYIAVGYLEKKGGDYYNAYLIAGRGKVCGIVRKSEGEACIFKRGAFPSIISTPFGNVAVGICYDARRKHFYDNIEHQEISCILFPHGSPSDPKRAEREKAIIDRFCGAYRDAFDVCVVFCNSKGKLGPMPGRTGWMMKKAGFVLNGMTAIYGRGGKVIPVQHPAVVGWAGDVHPQNRKGAIQFYRDDIAKGNWFFRKFIMARDIRNGVRFYEREKQGAGKT